MGRKKKINIPKENEDFELPELEQETETEKENSNIEVVSDVRESDNSANAKSELERLLSGGSAPAIENELPEKGKRGRKPKNAEPEKAPVLIPGELVVEICGNISGAGMHMIDKWTSKNPLPFHYLLPREDQVTRLAPLAEKFIEALKLQSDPISAFVYTMCATTFTNYILAKTIVANETKN